MIKGPKNARPTTRGWVHVKTGELLKSQKITQEQIDEFNGVTLLTEVVPAPEPQPEPVVLTEAEPEVTETELLVEEPKPAPVRRTRSVKNLFS